MYIHYFHIDHNAPCLPPKFCITIVFNFFFRGGGVNKVRYGLCENGEYGKRPHFRLTCVTKKRLSLSFSLVSTGTVESTKNTLGSLSNNNGDGNENVTLKVNSRCFKLYRALFHLVYFVKCWQIFLELNAKGLYQSSEKEKESCCLVFPSSTKREIRQFHVVVVQRRQRNVHVRSCCFANLNLFFLPFSLPSPSSLLKLPVV